MLFVLYYRVYCTWIMDHLKLGIYNEQTACVIAETVQAEAGIIAPAKEWMQALRKKCTETGTLLILDEIQTGFGRTGKLWGFEHFDIVPDIVLLGKALGGGMPFGAFIADKKMMDAFTITLYWVISPHLVVTRFVVLQAWRL